MGTFAGYFGELYVPEERRQELAERMLVLFTQGGMMTLEQVKVMDVATELIYLPEINEKKTLLPPTITLRIIGGKALDLMPKQDRYGATKLAAGNLIM